MAAEIASAIAGTVANQIATSTVIEVVKDATEDTEAQELRDRLRDMTSEVGQRSRDNVSYSEMSEDGLTVSTEEVQINDKESLMHAEYGAENNLEETEPVSKGGLSL